LVSLKRTIGAKGATHTPNKSILEKYQQYKYSSRIVEISLQRRGDELVPGSREFTLN